MVGRFGAHQVVGPNQPFALKDARFRPRDDEVFANEFGVAADGTDQTLNLGRALSHAATYGKTLVIPPGTFYVLDLPIPSNTIIRGFGARSVLRRFPTGIGGLSNALRLNGSNITISDLTVDGNRAALAQADNRGVIDSFLANINSIVLERLWVTEGAEKGIRAVDHGNDYVIRDCLITNIDEDAVIIQQTANHGSGVTLSGNRVDGCAGNGLMVRGSNDGTTWFQREVVIANNRVRNVTGLCIETWCEDSTITGNITEGGTFGISNGPGEKAAISGNVVNGASTIGIEVAATGNCEWVACTGNTVRGAGVGFSCSAGANFVSMTGNTIDYTGTGSAVHTNSVDTAIVSDNVIRTSGASYGIRFQSGVEAIAVGNRVDGSTTTASSNGIFFGDVTEIVCGNNLSRNYNYGIRLSSASSVYGGTIVGNHVNDNTDPYDAALSGGASAAAVVFGSNYPVIP